MRTLGIDYGTKRIGLALSDDDGRIAFPHGVILNSKRILYEIVALVKEEKVERVVIGQSLTTAGLENTIEKMSRDFGVELEKFVGVDYIDERFTSHEARLREFGKGDTHARKTKKKILKVIDDHAAQILLQRYLDKKNI